MTGNMLDQRLHNLHMCCTGLVQGTKWVYLTMVWALHLDMYTGAVSRVQ